MNESCPLQKRKPSPIELFASRSICIYFLSNGSVWWWQYVIQPCQGDLSEKKISVFQSKSISLGNLNPIKIWLKPNSIQLELNFFLSRIRKKERNTMAFAFDARVSCECDGRDALRGDLTQFIFLYEIDWIDWFIHALHWLPVPRFQYMLLKRAGTPSGCLSSN